MNSFYSRLLRMCATSFFLVTLMFFLVGPYNSFATSTLYGWNSPNDSGETWDGWTYFNGVPEGANDYGAPGWRKNDGLFYSSGSNWFPRVAAINGYSGSSQLAMVVEDEIAPLSSDGSALKVYDAPDATYFGAGHWYMWGDNFGTHALADGFTDRLSFYMKVDGLSSDLPTSGALPSANMHFGTYLCWEGGGVDGVSCPKEASNQHYYHYLVVNDGAWLHVQLDQHPTHQRGMSEPNEPDNDPAYISDGKHYFENMNSFYLEIRYDQGQPTAYWIDEVKLWNQIETENEESIGSNVWVGYWPATDKWEIGFGSVWPGRPMQASFEIRWSTTPITNANYSSATIVDPEYYERGLTKTVELSDSGWSKSAWTRFELPDAVESAAETIYFAIRDVSSVDNGDGYNSPTMNIKTIDYALPSSLIVLPPRNFRTVPTG